MPNAGNVIISPNTLIRTGTGNIDIAAGGDLLLGYAFGGYDASGNLKVTETDPQTAAIYTAGKPSPTAPAGQFVRPPARNAALGDAAYIRRAVATSVSMRASDIRKRAECADHQRLVYGVVVPLANQTNPTVNPSWWLMFSQFKQGIGVLVAAICRSAQVVTSSIPQR